ncbi:PIG-L deacetylase family protein [Rubellimicrobium aerolatum]|uniref:PIG-L deacetylase family protein n=1 Tax=Rubellimicrobium aerolatum TaxID=490979 RepID=A0ABW0S9E4_9RHOB|nr:PIG-L family deacetylase [Rubellimicrobium aerolatum]MBP1804912.1 LmbE family N-acetylglucosaminyl deacetylase [Rubellimicrobium aerolatum]
MDGLPERLARGERVPERVVLVVAHPDDETLALASRLRLFDDLCIVHLTDGAPRDGADAGRAGVAAVEDYAQLRRQELRAAMAALGCGADLRCCWHPDQEAIRHGAAILKALGRELRDAAAVVTHAYEHGHPDHDAAALCVALALGALRAEGRAGPVHYEFPGYHLRDGRAVFGRFWEDGGCPETVLPLSEEDRARRRFGLSRFASQEKFLSQVPEWEERLRVAPSYDFRRSAPPGEAWYGRLGWAMTPEVWRAEADALLDRFGT